MALKVSFFKVSAVQYDTGLFDMVILHHLENLDSDSER